MGRTWVRVSLSVAITIGLSAFLLGRVDLSEMPVLVRNVEPNRLLVFLGLSFLGLLVRAERYRVLLSGRVDRLPMILVTAVRNFLVDLLPARTGSLSYIALLTGRLGVPLEPVMGSFVLSFLYDLVAMAVLLTVALVLELGRFEGAALLGVLIGILAVGSVGALFLIEPILRFSRRFVRRWPRIETFVDGLVESLRETAGLAQRAWVLGLSVLIRVLKFTAYWALLLALLNDRGFTAETLPFWRVFLGITGAELSATLPIHGIAGFGTYEAAWALGFSYLGLDEKTAILSGFATHFLSQLHDYSLGLVALGVILVWGRRARGPAGGRE